MCPRLVNDLSELTPYFRRRWRSAAGASPRFRCTSTGQLICDEIGLIISLLCPRLQIPKANRPGTCAVACQHLRGRVAVETKYDGERCAKPRSRLVDETC